MPGIPRLAVDASVPLDSTIAPRPPRAISLRHTQDVLSWRRWMRIFQTKAFARRKNRPADADLRRAVEEVETGLVDANLGGSLVKKRVAGKAQGKRGGYRTIVAVQTREKAFFLYCFAKNERDNITWTEFRALKKLSDELMQYSAAELEKALESGALLEVTSDDQDR